MCALLLNQLSGLVIWGDAHTIDLWVSYVGIHVLIVLGIYDLSSAGSAQLHALAAKGAFGHITSLRGAIKTLSIVTYWQSITHSRAQGQGRARAAMRASKAAAAVKHHRKSLSAPGLIGGDAGAPGLL